MKKVTRKLIPLLLAIAVIVTLIPLGKAEAATTELYQKTNCYVIKTKEEVKKYYKDWSFDDVHLVVVDSTWKWHKSNGRWWFGNNKEYAYLGIYQIKHDFYAFDKTGYMITNAFISDMWFDNNGKGHAYVYGEWKTDKNGKWRYQVTNKEGFKQKGYLSGKKTEWFGTSATGDNLSAIMNWTMNGGYKYKITFTKNGYAKRNGKFLTNKEWTFQNGRNYSWTPLYGAIDYDGAAIRKIQKTAKYKNNIKYLPTHTVKQDTIMPKK